MRSDISEIARNSEELGQKLDSLADSYKFGNALLKKATMSTEQLARDLNRTRELRDYEYYELKPQQKRSQINICDL